MSIFSTSDQPLDICVLVLPGSSMMTLASTLDTMRAANRIGSRELFRWKIVTLDGTPALLSCAMPVQADAELVEKTRGDMLFVIAGFNHQRHLTKQRLALIKLVSRNFKAVGGIEAGSWVLARCGLLDRRLATTHWEDQEEFAMQFPRVQLRADRFVVDESLFTTGGALPTFDFMLHLIRLRYGYPLALEVASAFIYEGVHSSTDPQPLVSLGHLQYYEPRVAAAIQLMGQHIDETVTVAEIADQLGVSVRTLENLFMQTLSLSPGAYYRRLRLQTARRLVIDTRLPLREIAIRSGFNSLPAFSRMFKQYYQQAPGDCRKQMVD